MRLPIFQVDSFATDVFKGNPAGVIPLTVWLPDDVMQNIAAENNVAATAFILTNSSPDRYPLRWFTPTAEIPLCAHGSIAAAWVICEALKTSKRSLTFETQAGDLAVERIASGRFAMNFPVDPYEETDLDSTVSAALGEMPTSLLRARYSVAVYEQAEVVRTLTPNISAINACTHAKRPGAVVVTAPADAGADHDFVSRFFAPGVGVDEDPVTGSAHCILAKYWTDRLGKANTRGYQASARGGTIDCEIQDDRVVFTGTVAPYLQGEISLTD